MDGKALRIERARRLAKEDLPLTKLSEEKFLMNIFMQYSCKANIYICLIWFLAVTPLIGQIDDPVTIEEVVIEDDQVKSTGVGENDLLFKADTLVGIKSLANILSRVSNSYIKSYGPGSIATSSIRGGNGNHSVIVWNGLPIQSPLLGLLDLSLIPDIAFDEVRFVKGGGSTYLGSGAIAGAIELNRLHEFISQSTIQLKSSVGSNSTFKSNFQFVQSNKQYSSKTSIGHVSSKNDFSFLPAPMLKLRKQTNAAYNRLNILQDFALLIGTKDMIEMNFWFHKSNTDIPPTLTQNLSEAFQSDNTVRSLITWKRFSNHSRFQIKIGSFFERQLYEDPQFLLEANNDFNSLITEVNYNLFVYDRYKIGLGFTYLHNKRIATASQDASSENRYSAYISFSSSVGKVQWQSSFRKERIDDIVSPLLPLFAIEYKPYKWMNMRGKLSRNFRVPTLNDRYWRPGGNENLIPEIGWSQEIGVDVFPKIKSNHWTFD